MDRLTKYIECYIPTETCNLRCHYCYITQKRLFNNKLLKFEHRPEEIRQALSVDRLGGPCLLNLCAGGETLLVQEVLEVVKELLKEGHYVMVVTNGILTKRFDDIGRFPSDLMKRLVFKFSLHYLELLRTGMLDTFFDNINKIKNAGCSYTVEITPSDELITHIPSIKKVCMERLGALCHVTIARDDRTSTIEVLSNHSFEDYKNIWGDFKSSLFDFKTTIFYKQRKEFCYAGEWSLYLNLNTGRLNQCYVGKELDNIYNDINRPLKLEAIGYHCTLPHCYNGHSFLTLGTIPELKTPAYAEVRDRKENNGGSWLRPEMRAFISQKLADNNKPYSNGQKISLELKRTYHQAVLLGNRIFR